MARIVIVEDNDSDRLILRAILEKAGHETFATLDVEEVLNRSRGGVHVVITDLQMPDTHGFELIMRLRTEVPDVPVIVVSGTGPEQLAMAEEVGASMSVRKPIDAEALLNAVATVTGGRPTLEVGTPDLAMEADLKVETPVDEEVAAEGEELVEGEIPISPTDVREIEAVASVADLSLAVSEPSVAAGGDVTLTLTARDARANLLPGLMNVAFGHTGGTSTGTISRVTDQLDGTYTATFTGQTVGTATSLQATIDGETVAQTADVTVTLRAVSLSGSSLAISRSAVATGEAVTLTLTARDADGNLLAGLTNVAFGHTGGTSTGDISAVTDQGNGTYTATFTGQAVGTATGLQATIDGNAVTSGSPTVTVRDRRSPTRRYSRYGSKRRKSDSEAVFPEVSESEEQSEVPAAVDLGVTEPFSSAEESEEEPEERNDGVGVESADLSALDLGEVETVGSASDEVAGWAEPASSEAEDSKEESATDVDEDLAVGTSGLESTTDLPELAADLNVETDSQDADLAAAVETVHDLDGSDLDAGLDADAGLDSEAEESEEKFSSAVEGFAADVDSLLGVEGVENVWGDLEETRDPGSTKTSTGELASIDRIQEGGWRIVLVEDDDENALLVERALEKVTGDRVEVRRGRNGVEGLTLLRESVPDLVILDLEMPGMEGQEALDEIRNDVALRAMPVAILSSSDRVADAGKSDELGGDHYILKTQDRFLLEVRLASLLWNLRDLKRVPRGPEDAVPGPDVEGAQADPEETMTPIAASLEIESPDKLRKRVQKRGWRIVLFEDDDAYALLIERALDKATDVDVDLRRGRTGLEGLALLREGKPDLVILDLKMPGMAGHEALAEIRGDDTLRGLPVAVLSSSDRKDDVAKSYGLGGNHYITKPDNPGELEAKLGSLLRNLRELKGVRRGSEGAETTAASGVGPDSMLAATVLRWGLITGVLIALYIFGRITGVF